jgi:chromosomal replication initiation ATPase DnaA
MNYAPVQMATTARQIARAAQRRIKEQTGMKVSLLLYPRDVVTKTPDQMLKIIATSQGMSPVCYKMKTRLRNITELRFLGALFLRRHFPAITLSQIARLFGGQDHTSIINALDRANNLIYTGDLAFTQKYNSALKSVEIWLRRDA